MKIQKEKLEQDERIRDLEYKNSLSESHLEHLKKENTEIKKNLEDKMSHILVLEQGKSQLDEQNRDLQRQLNRVTRELDSVKTSHLVELENLEKEKQEIQ